MSCWVVPMVAAEMWGVSVDQILAKAVTGELPSKSENGFMFIDVAPDSPTITPPKGLRRSHPPTYIAVTGAERAALTAIDESATVDAECASQERNQPAAPMSIPMDDWRAGRSLTARSRRAPAIT